MELINRAIAHITEQMMEKQKRSAIVAIEEYLTELCKNERVANKLLAEGKTLEGALKAIENRAKEITEGRTACVGPQEAKEIIERYYGITEEDKTGGRPAKKDIDIIDITDLM